MTRNNDEPSSEQGFHEELLEMLQAGREAMAREAASREAAARQAEGHQGGSPIGALPVIPEDVEDITGTGRLTGGIIVGDLAGRIADDHRRRRGRRKP
jgi:hypothetical protein